MTISIIAATKPRRTSIERRISWIGSMPRRSFKIPTAAKAFAAMSKIPAVEKPACSDGQNAATNTAAAHKAKAARPRVLLKAFNGFFQGGAGNKPAFRTG
jgi:hypothetical protein